MTSIEEIDALTNLSSYWEYAAYVAIASVAIGVAGEVAHDFTAWFKTVRWWDEKGNKYSAILLVIALFAELFIQINQNSINGRIVAFLQRETAAAQERTAEIERVTAWRILQPETTAKLAAALELIPDTIPHIVLFASAQNDMESLFFAAQIGAVFMNAKIWTLHQQARTYSGRLYWGLRIVGPDSETTRAIKRAFADAHIDFSTDDVPGAFQSYGHMDANETTILVGPKKPPFEP